MTATFGSFRRAVAGVALVALGAVLPGGCGSREGAKPEGQPRPVVTGVPIVTVSAEEGPRIVEALGTVRAANVAEVALQAMGRITSLPVEEGRRVVAGDLLAAIDDAAARAQLAAAEAAHAEALSGAQEAEAAVAQAEAAKLLAEKTWERYRALFEEKVVTAQEYDEAEARRAMAAREHQRALERKAQTAARIERTAAEVSGARTMLGHTRVTAPFAGVVTQRRADAGSMAVPGVPIVVLEEAGRYRIEAAVPERWLGAVRAGTRAEALLDSLPGKAFRVAVSEVVPAVDPATRTFLVKADLTAPGLRTGQSGRLRFPAGRERILSVPREAVVRAGGLDGVFLLSPDNVARLALVTTGQPLDGRVEILSGLSAGDRVAADPAGRLADGVRVEAAR